MRNEFDAVDRRRGSALRVLAAIAWLLLLGALLSGQEQQRQESTTVPAATFQWTGNSGTSAVAHSVRTEARSVPGLHSGRLTTGNGGGAWTMEVEGDRLDTFPFIDFEEGVVGVFVNGDFLACAGDD